MKPLDYPWSQVDFEMDLAILEYFNDDKGQAKEAAATARGDEAAGRGSDDPSCYQA